MPFRGFEHPVAQQFPPFQRSERKFNTTPTYIVVYHSTTVDAWHRNTNRLSLRLNRDIFCPHSKWFRTTRHINVEARQSVLTRGFHTATETPVMREEGTPVVPPPGRVGAVGIGNGPAILSKFMVSSFRMSVFDNARLLQARQEALNT